MAALSRRIVFCFSICLLGLSSSQAAEFYISTTGDDNNPGTLRQPFASLDRGQQAASPGDTVWIRGGVYDYVAGPGASEHAVLFDKSGTPGNRINYWAYPGETPVFDFFQYQPVERIRGFSVQSDYLHFRGLELRGVQQIITNVNESWAIRVEAGSNGGDGGDFNIFEQLNLHHNEGPGLFILDGGNNLVLHSDSHHNYDPDRGGENADGFGSHSSKDSNMFVGTRAWENSDDGYDLIHSPGTVVIEDSWAWQNGYIPETNQVPPNGDGNGFKSGGFVGDHPTLPPVGEVPRHTVQGNLAFANRSRGFDANGQPGGIDWINNTAFDNGTGFALISTRTNQGYVADHYLRNNIAFSNNSNTSQFNQPLVDDEFNTWNPGFAVDASDFVSFDSSGLDGPRQSDGSLPIVDFLRLAPGSNLIDAGQDVELPFLGDAPDLGAFEFTFEPAVPGDADDDGDVDFDDFQLISANLRNVVLHGTQGDLTGNGLVDLEDFRQWKANYLGSALAASKEIPEPQTLVLLLLGFSAFVHRLH